MTPPKNETTPLLDQPVNLRKKNKAYLWEALYAIADFDLWTIYSGLTALTLNVALGGGIIALSIATMIFAGPIAMAVSAGLLTILAIKNIVALLHTRGKSKKNNPPEEKNQNLLLPLILDTVSLALAIVACSFLATKLVSAISVFSSLSAIAVSVPALFLASFLVNAYSCYKKMQDQSLDEETRASYKRQMIASSTVSVGIFFGLLMPAVLTACHVSLATILPASALLITAVIPPLALAISLIAVTVLAISRNPPFNKAWHSVKNCWKKLFGSNQHLNQAQINAPLVSETIKIVDSSLPKETSTPPSIQPTASNQASAAPRPEPKANASTNIYYASNRPYASFFMTKKPDAGSSSTEVCEVKSEQKTFKVN